MEQSLRQRERLKMAEQTVTEVDLQKAAIVCGCLVMGVILGAVGILIDHAWPYITAGAEYIVNAVSAAL